MTIPIIFLPRSIGLKEGQLSISTSMGDIVIQLIGTGLKNIYEIPEYLGIVVPIDVSFEYPIQIYNPHDTILEIQEITTSANYLQLTLPHEPDGPTATTPSMLLKILPHTRKSVAHIQFRASARGIHQGYIHIRAKMFHMVVPVEIRAVSGDY